jgi:hypothetical protein
MIFKPKFISEIFEPTLQFFLNNNIISDFLFEILANLAR